jgi:xanthine dehydrogenase accessory factor
MMQSTIPGRRSTASKNSRTRHPPNRDYHRAMLSVLETLLKSLASGDPAAFCVVTQARGSTPQKRGASMLVTRAGQTVGTLGGGCVEAETRQRAIQALAAFDPTTSNGAVQLSNFKLDNDYGWDDGMVCGGLMDIAVAVVAPDSALAREARRCVDLLRDRVACEFRLNIAPIENESDAMAFPLEPSPRLVLAGAGHVSQAVAIAAAQMGFEIVVVDDRADFASADRFPGAHCIVGPIDLELSKLNLDPSTYVLILTRGHKNDASALAAVVNSSAKYVGLIGSKRKVRTILGQLLEAGTPRDKIDRVHGPVGLELGAISPSEIAISILAELIAVRRGVEQIRSMKLPREQLDAWLGRNELGK